MTYDVRKLLRELIHGPGPAPKPAEPPVETYTVEGPITPIKSMETDDSFPFHQHKLVAATEDPERTLYLLRTQLATFKTKQEAADVARLLAPDIPWRSIFDGLEAAGLVAFGVKG